MAYIGKFREGWRVQVQRDGIRISKKGRPFGAVANPTRSQQPKLNKPPIGIKVPKISAPIAHPKAKHAAPARLRIEAMREAKELMYEYEGARK